MYASVIYKSNRKQIVGSTLSSFVLIITPIFSLSQKEGFRLCELLPDYRWS